MKKRKNYVMFVIILLVTPLLAMQVIGHPPQDMQLEYKLDTQNLNVTITHVVSDPNDHYIYLVEIEKNNVLYYSELYSSQPTQNTFTYNYTVEADIGDELVVTAYCNIAGSIQRSLIVAGDNQPPDAPYINGPQSGNPGKQYDYIFNSADFEGHDVRYYIDWGDESFDVTEYNPSGSDVTVSHIWDEAGDYTITAYAEDSFGATSRTSIFQVTIPRNKAINRPILNWLQSYPSLFPILQKIIQQNWFGL